MRRSHSFFAPTFVLVSVLLLPSMLLADVTGSILGVVRDQSQAVIKGARVWIINTETNLSLQTVSAAEGSKWKPRGPNWGVSSIRKRCWHCLSMAAATSTSSAYRLASYR